MSSRHTARGSAPAPVNLFDLPPAPTPFPEPSGPPPPTPTRTPPPSSQPQAMLVRFAIEGLGYTQLASDAKMLGMVALAVKSQIVQAAAGGGITEDMVEVALSAGSVVVSAKVTPPSSAQVSQDAMTAAMAGPSFQSGIMQAVSAVPGISMAVMGTMGVSKPSVVAAGAAPTSTSKAREARGPQLAAVLTAAVCAYFAASGLAEHP